MRNTGDFDLTLTLVSGDDDLPTRNFKLSPGKIMSVGRSSKTPIKQLQAEQANVFINNPVISRYHAELKSVVMPGTEEYNVAVYEKASMHGTYVNGTRIVNEVNHAIKNGDIVRFGADVQRGDEIFEAPEYRVGIQTALPTSSLKSPSSSWLFPAADSPSVNPVKDAKDGYYVPDSDSSQASSVIHIDDYESDAADDGYESHSSAPVVECVSTQKRAFTPEVVVEGMLGSASSPVDLTDGLVVPGSRVVKPVEIIDADVVPETIIVDELPSDASNHEDEVCYADESDEEEAIEFPYESDEEVKQVSDYGVSSDDEEDLPDPEEEPLDANSVRSPSVESEDEPSIVSAPRLADILFTPSPAREVAEPPANQGSRKYGLTNEDLFPHRTESQNSGPFRPAQGGLPQPQPPRPIMNIQSLLDSDIPKADDHSELNHLLQKHPRDQPSFQPAFHGNNPYDLPRTASFGSSDYLGPPGVSTMPYNSFGYYAPPPPPPPPSVPVPFMTHEMYAHPLSATSCGILSPSAVHHVSSYDSAMEAREEPPPPPPPRSIAQQNKTALRSLPAKKRSFDQFVEDLHSEVSELPRPTNPSPLRNVTTHSVTVPPSTPEPERVLTPGSYVNADDTSALEDTKKTSTSILVEAVQTNSAAVEPPAKRARLQSVAKAAGTVLASAVAGGVATFYALGLAPESFFV